MLNNVYRNCILIFAVALFVQGCANYGSLGSSANKRVYDMDYESMKGTVRDLIRGRQLNIDAVNETQGGQKISLVISQTKNVGNSNTTTAQNQGRVIIEAIDDQTSSVEIENPEYHYTVPDFEKENYRRQLFPPLEEYEKKEKVESEN